MRALSFTDLRTTLFFFFISLGQCQFYMEIPPSWTLGSSFRVQSSFSVVFDCYVPCPGWGSSCLSVSSVTLGPWRAQANHLMLPCKWNQILQRVDTVSGHHDACWLVVGHLATGTESCCEQNVRFFWVCTSQWDWWPTLAILCLIIWGAPVCPSL